MPLYEYHCQSCGERMEAIRRFSDPPYTECPKCGGELKKLISSPAIKFKGSGFYINDYSRAGSSGEKSDKGSNSEASSKSADGPPTTKSTETSSSASPASSSSKSSNGSGDSSAGSSSKD